MCGTRVQEQGRAGAARRRDRVPALAAWKCRPSRASDDDGEPDHAPGRATTQPFSALAFKILQRPVRRQADVLPRLFRRAEFRRHRVLPDQAASASASAACCRCTPASAPKSRKCAPATSPRPWASRTSPPATRCAIENKIITLERMVFPVPVISVAVEPKTKVDQEKMGMALQRLAKEDPSFRVHTDEESGQTIISGMGELHLEIIVDRMKREFKRRGQCRQAAGGLPRNHPRARSIRRQARQAVRRPRPVRPRVAEARAATRPARASSSSTASWAAWCRANSSRPSRRASRKPARRRDGRLPGGGREGHPVRRLVPRRRLGRNRVPHGVDLWLQGRLPQGQAGDPRADHEGRSA